MIAWACRPALVAALALATACGQAREDSAAVESARPDSGGAPAVGVAPANTGVKVQTSSKAVQKADSIIGRDSAAGPTFEIDAKGNTTPIKKP